MPRAREWTVTSAPQVVQLMGVESADGSAYATGRQGVLLERTAPGEWVQVVTPGTAANGRHFHDASTTDDGRRVWFCGENGAFGYYDTESGEVATHDAPYDVTATFTSVSANGPAGEETVHVAADTGKVVRCAVDGADCSVRSVAVLGDGTALSEVIDNDREVFACDARGKLYHTTDYDQVWKSRRLAETGVRAVSFDDENVYEVTEDGTVHEEVSLWGDGSPLPDSSESAATFATEIDTDRGDTVVVVGEGGELRLSEGGGGFREVAVGTDATLYGAEVMANGTVIAVGENGTIVEGVPDGEATERAQPATS